MERPPMRMSGPVLDAADPVALAHFYQRLLGWDLVECEGPLPGSPPNDGWAVLKPADRSTKLEFQWESKYIRPVWPPVDGDQQMMLHLDFLVEDLETGVAWAVEAGATLAEHQPQDDVQVMLDPEGHPFCICLGPV